MDNFWIAVIAGSIAVYSWKILGFALPKRFAEKEEVVVLDANHSLAGQDLTFDLELVNIDSPSKIIMP